MRIELTVEAEDDIRRIGEWIKRDNPRAASRVRERIHVAIAGLADFPRLGRLLADRGWYELVVTGLPYIVSYNVDDGVVTILAVVHAARDRG